MSLNECEMSSETERITDCIQKKLSEKGTWEEMRARLTNHFRIKKTTEEIEKKCFFSIKFKAVTGAIV